MKVCIATTGVVQDRRQFLLSDAEQEIVLSELLSHDVAVIPCNPKVNQVFYQQELEDWSTAAAHLSRLLILQCVPCTKF